MRIGKRVESDSLEIQPFTDERNDFSSRQSRIAPTSEFDSQRIRLRPLASGRGQDFTSHQLRFEPLTNGRDFSSQQIKRDLFPSSDVRISSQQQQQSIIPRVLKNKPGSFSRRGDVLLDGPEFSSQQREAMPARRHIGTDIVVRNVNGGGFGSQNRQRNSKVKYQYDRNVGHSEQGQGQLGDSDSLSVAKPAYDSDKLNNWQDRTVEDRHYIPSDLDITDERFEPKHTSLPEADGFLEYDFRLIPEPVVDIHDLAEVLTRDWDLIRANRVMNNGGDKQLPVANANMINADIDSRPRDMGLSKLASSDFETQRRNEDGVSSDLELTSLSEALPKPTWGFLNRKRNKVQTETAAGSNDKLMQVVNYRGKHSKALKNIKRQIAQKLAPLKTKYLPLLDNMYNIL